MFYRRKRKACGQLLVWLLIIAMTLQSVPLYAAEESGSLQKETAEETGQESDIQDAQQDNPVEESQDLKEETSENDSTQEIQQDNSAEESQDLKEETSENDSTQEIQQDNPAEESQNLKEETSENPAESGIMQEPQESANLEETIDPEGEVIEIHNLEQLWSIGSEEYPLDAQYRLMSEIELDRDNLWTLPEGFTGKFVGGESVSEDSLLYDEETDTIYIYNNYQLMTAASEYAEKEPVMSGDMFAEDFGVGQFVYPAGEENGQNYLTYSRSHRYVLTRNFTEQMPKLKAEMFAEGTTTDEQKAGRAHVGQVYTTIGDEKYILIGNEQQLRAIGTDKRVAPMLFVRRATGHIEPYYPGDADLNLRTIDETGIAYKNIENDKKEFQYFKQEPALEELMDPDWGGVIVVGKDVVGLKNEGTENPSIGGGIAPMEYTISGTLAVEYSDLKYSSDANYIIFRNIDLSASGENSNKEDDDWIPVNFSGQMEGRLHMQEGAVPVISHINVHQTGKINLETTNGIGFFGTISNAVNTDTFGSAGTVTVKNLKLDTVSIQNDSTEVDENIDTLVEGLLKLLGGLLGTVLDLLDPILGNLELGDVIRGILEVKKNSPDVFAAGSFSGRITGDVSIENCTVTGASVISARGITGGFVGYTEGMTEYDGLSKTLRAVVKILSTLLNIIPGVGLGDLITVLLENDLALGELIPTGYIKPSITNCSVELQTGNTGNIQSDYHGGFVGIQTGTNMANCTVSGLCQVQAKNGAGGFAGTQRDAVINGALNDLGVQLYTLDIQSKQTDCYVTGSDIRIEAAENYAGGMNGLMANSISESSGVSSLQSVTAGKYAGGFSGRATIGYGLAVGGVDEKDKTLLNSVSKLLTELLSSGNEDKLNTLLSLTGAMPSEIRGCSVNGNQFTVESKSDYAGGLIGQGDGTKITGSNGVKTTITGMASVKAENYAGGIAGSITTADAIGVLNNTVGVGQYLPFEISDTSVSGDYLSVTAAKKYAAGAAGLFLGGSVERTTITGIKEVRAGNYAGGFGGRAGAGGLASAGGLNILGLVKINNVLSLAEGINVKIDDSRVTGTETGFTALADGSAELTDSESVTAGGFLAEAVGVQVTGSHAEQLRSVKAEKPADKDSYAGGFVGRSHTGGLAGLAQEDEDGSLKLPGILDVSSLLNLLPYLLPEYTDTTVTFISNEENPQVEAQLAGGFAGAMQSGKVDNSTSKEPYAVYGLESVKGQSHAGGFGGKVDAGAAASSDGLKLLGGVLSLDINNLLGVLNVYVPAIKSAGVKSAEKGFVVEAADKDSSAGGYIGYGSGVQIDHSDVTSLKHTKVTPPSYSLESADGSSYFDLSQSAYAVRGGGYAGGYIGCVDIDSAAAVGGGLKLLQGISIENVLSALDAVPSVIEDSNVSGCVGGFSVLADGTDMAGNVIGKAGGFAGEMSGTIIRRSDVENFEYIIGQEMAGGYAGIMEPGDVASVLEDGSVLNGIANIKDSVASLINSFIPIIEDSQTTCIPCGGAVRAQGLTDTMTIRGMAGGYVGYNHGGRITGTNEECAAYRIRSVYGEEFAGGFTGLMETADLASTGNLSLLFGLIETSNVLSLLKAVYPTETNTAVYGPLRKVSVETWNKWAQAVGSNGVYGYQFPTEPVESQAELDALIQQYAYGYHVKAGRSEPGSMDKQAGTAGGYVGRMKSGVVTEAHAWDAKNIVAYESAGGFVGEMMTGGAAEVGKVSLLGLDITGSISAVQTFVPVIRNSDVTGFQSGMQVKATGIPQPAGEEKIEKVGYAGGFVGHMIGGQIWGSWKEETITGRSAVDAVPDPSNDRCFAANLRKIEGTNAVGGFAGQIDPASAAALDTASSNGLLGGLLQKLIGTPGDLLSLLNATLSTVRGADASAWDPWGIVVNGSYTDGSSNTKYAKTAGGFAGEINGAVIGEKDQPESGVHVTNIRSITGGEHAGGFFGLADVSAVAEISGEGNTSILGSLVKLGATDVLDAFRTYVYDSSVSGSETAGLEVLARDSKQFGYVNDPVYTGNAGGFGGTLLNGSVKGSSVTNLREVEGQNYTGGFIGHLGKSGVADVDNLGALSDLLSIGAGVLDSFGSHVDDSTAEGIPDGFTVKSRNSVNSEDKSEISGGFAGYADLARMKGNSVVNLKQVASGEIAGGFTGKTSFAYLADINADSALVNVLVDLLNRLLKALWIEDLEKGNVIKIDLGILTVDALYDGNLVHVNLLGLDISIALAKENHLATVYIGDSKIEINCADDGSIQDGDKVKNEIRISLIKANRTRVDGCTVTGISYGYDVYGGGAGNKRNGSSEQGYAGGFVGLNDEGLLKNNNMYLADVVRGTKGKTGPFTGASSLDSNWDFNTIFGIEGENNQYRIYREPAAAFTEILGKGSEALQSGFESDAAWNIYTVTHMIQGKVEQFKDLKDAVMSNGAEEKELLAYREDGSMAVLMKDTPTSPGEPDDMEPEPDVQDPCKETVELRIKKVWKKDQEEDRPDQITLHVTRSYVIYGKTEQDTEFQKEIVLTASDYESKDIWEKVFSGPDYTAYRVGRNGKHYYYTYSVSEDALAGYETAITYTGQYQYNMKITNTKYWFENPLPDTGGTSVVWLYMIGFLLLTALGISEYRRRRIIKAE